MQCLLCEVMWTEPLLAATIYNAYLSHDLLRQLPEGLERVSSGDTAAVRALPSPWRLQTNTNKPQPHHTPHCVHTGIPTRQSITEQEMNNATSLPDSIGATNNKTNYTTCGAILEISESLGTPHHRNTQQTTTVILLLTSHVACVCVWHKKINHHMDMLTGERSRDTVEEGDCLLL